MPRPAHRPSRRQAIVDAAIRQFSRANYADTSIADIAKEAGVAPSAVYYHFGGKEALYLEALDQAQQVFSNAASETRESHDALDAQALRDVIANGWSTLQAAPAHGRMIARHAPGPFPEARKRHNDWVEQHVRRGRDYVLSEATPPTDDPRHAAEQTLALRSMIRLVLEPLAMTVEDRSPLSSLDPERTAQALQDTCLRMATPASVPATAAPGA